MQETMIRLHHMARSRLFLVLVAILGVGGGFLLIFTDDEQSSCYRHEQQTKIHLTPEANESSWRSSISQANQPEQNTFNLDQVHLYTNIGIPLEKACELGITVNGLWNGWGMKSPVASMHPAMLLWRFKNDQHYVREFHSAGFWHGSTLSNVYAHPSQLTNNPALKAGIDRTVTGEHFELDGGWYLGKQPFMSQNNPQWQNALLTRSKQMIDAGSDVIVFDEPFGNTIFASLPMPQFPGFSEWDLQLLADALAQNFTPDELAAQFGLHQTPTVETLRQQFAQADLSQLLYCGCDENQRFYLAQNAGSHAELSIDAETRLTDASPTERLWRYFRQLQLRENFKIRKRLVEEMQAYALRTRGRQIPIGANLAELEGYSVLTQQMPVLYLAELFDFLAFEMAYRPPIEERLAREGKDAFVLDARGKWIAWYKLGEALVGPHRALAYPSQELVDAWLGPEKKINYLSHLLMEAYAAQGGFIIPFTGFDDTDENRLKQHTQFVQQQIEFYQEVESVASIGVLYAHSEESPPHHWSYLGVTQALYESGLPFSVLFTSSTQAGYPAPSLEKLNRYEVLLLPITVSMAPQTADVIQRYAEQGGTVLLFDRDHPFDATWEPGFHADGDGGFLVITPEQSMSIGERYYRAYDDATRLQLVDAVRTYLAQSHPILWAENHRAWAPLVYTQPEEQRVLMHLLNYDYLPDSDEFEPKHNLTIRLDLSIVDGLGEDTKSQCMAYAPQRVEPMLLDCRQVGDQLEMTVPALFQYELIVIETI